MKQKKNRLTSFLLIAAFLAGVGFLAYPTFADYWNSFHQSRAIASYVEEVAEMNSEAYDRILDSAKEYNQELADAGLKWEMDEDELERYRHELNFSKNGSMGYITIQKINVFLPIYHGTSESVLQVSIGHLEQTSLPVGGEGTHCVLSGHRGLPSAKLFTDLDRLVTGDTFSLSILNETFTYEVDQIRIVEPTDISDLQPEEGKDYCTLVTCTPYGINTHRLLVRGHRISNPQGEARVASDAIVIRPVYVMPFLGGGLAVLAFFLLWISDTRKRILIRRARKVKRQYQERELIY